mmetsp:Transcript_5241/g.7859  ORF Transcript_5241/g.7859 Transcript_5241/m.7859 type:complete len:100 (+) Transcript_5241:219-518(+)
MFMRRPTRVAQHTALFFRKSRCAPKTSQHFIQPIEDFALSVSTPEACFKNSILVFHTFEHFQVTRCQDIGIEYCMKFSGMYWRSNRIILAMNEQHRRQT